MTIRVVVEFVQSKLFIIYIFFIMSFINFYRDISFHTKILLLHELFLLIIGYAMP